MRHAIRTVLIGTSAGILTTTIALADPAKIADGKPWNANNGKGGKILMTLAPDGSGRVKRGIISKRISWRDVDGALCLSGLPGQGEKCMVIQKINGGYRGKSPDGTVLSLTR